MNYIAAEATHVGLRAENQDVSLAVLSSAHGSEGEGLFAVVDGMGGHAAGDVAAKIIAETLRNSFCEAREIENDLVEWVIRSHSCVVENARVHPERRGMGAVLSAVLLRGCRMTLVHVGDSRAWLWSGGVLTQLSHDHSYVGRLLREGAITKDQARTHPLGHLIEQFIGADSEPPVPQVVETEVSRGDRVLLASDGLSDVVPEEEIAQCLHVGTPQQSANALVEAALCDHWANSADGSPMLIRGGKDNITVVVVEMG